MSKRGAACGRPAVTPAHRTSLEPSWIWLHQICPCNCQGPRGRLRPPPPGPAPHGLAAGPSAQSLAGPPRPCRLPRGRSLLMAGRHSGHPGPRGGVSPPAPGAQPRALVFALSTISLETVGAGASGQLPVTFDPRGLAVELEVGLRGVAVLSPVTPSHHAVPCHAVPCHAVPSCRPVMLSRHAVPSRRPPSAQSRRWAAAARQSSRSPSRFLIPVSRSFVPTRFLQRELFSTSRILGSGRPAPRPRALPSCRLQTSNASLQADPAPTELRSPRTEAAPT